MISMFQMQFEATLLLAKCNFYRCSFQSALTMFENASLDTINVKSSSPRLLHIIAEAFAIKGIHSHFSIRKTLP